MSFDNLFRQLTDIRFQADKILKSEKIEEDMVQRFANYSNELKSSLIDLELNEDILLHVRDIEEIDSNYQAPMSLVPQAIAVISFGLTTKQYRKKQREAYFRENIKNIRDRYANIDFLLKES